MGVLVSQIKVQPYVRLWFILAIANVAIFAVMGFQEHRWWTRNAKVVAQDYETFSCWMLERRAMSAQERQADWFWCCYECIPPVQDRMFKLGNLGAFLLEFLLLELAGTLGFHNQVVVFYGGMPIAIVLWWCLLGFLVRVLMNRRRSSALSVSSKAHS